MAGYKAISIVTKNKQETRIIDGIRTLLNLTLTPLEFFISPSSNI